MPTIMQQDMVECGAACLAMILAYHGRWIGLEALRELCGVGRDGTKAGNIVRAARTLGLTAKGLRRETAELRGLRLPAIVFWQFNHFIVLEGFAGGRTPGVWVNDPATGPRLIEQAEFDRGFTGLVLAIEPGEGFERRGARASLAGLLARRLRPLRRPLLVAAVAACLLIVPGFLAAGLAQFFTDQVVSGGHAGWLAGVLAGMGALALLRCLILWLQLVTLARAQVALGIAESAEQMKSVLALPLGFFAQRHAGDIANRFWMIDRLGGLLVHGLAPAGASLLAIAGYGAALFLLDPVLALTTAASTLAAVGLLALSARGLEDVNRRMVADEARLHGVMVQGLSMVEDYRASGAEAAFVRRWAGLQARLVETGQTAGRRAALLTAGAGLLVALGGVAVLSVGALRVMSGALSLGGLLAFQLLQHGFTSPVLSLVGLGAQVQQVRGLAERLDDLRPPEPAVTPAPPSGASQPGLELRGLGFGYAPLEADFIADLSLHVPPGTRLALVGGSGSGKSTLGRLIVGLLAPRAGAVLLDGAPIGDVPAAELRRRVAYVDQTVALFDGPVQDNLTLWDPTLPEGRMVAAAQDAQVHDTISARPGAYASLLTEGGGNLSGGERQRLALARALALQPDLLVLDEATSALDPPAEQAVSEAIRRRGCSCVIIAHRLSTIRDCDQIVVLDSGRIAERGTHAELMARNGAYARLVET